MTTQHWHQMIEKGLQGLPVETLAEIADFILNVRKKTLQPDAFEEERQLLALQADLLKLRKDSEAHLDEEFAGYEQRYPRE